MTLNRGERFLEEAEFDDEFFFEEEEPAPEMQEPS